MSTRPRSRTSSLPQLHLTRPPRLTRTTVLVTAGPLATRRPRSCCESYQPVKMTYQVLTLLCSAGFAGAFIDREFESKGLDFIDKEKAKRHGMCSPSATTLLRSDTIVPSSHSSRAQPGCFRRHSVVNFASTRFATCGMRKYCTRTMPSVCLELNMTYSNMCIMINLPCHCVLPTIQFPRSTVPQLLNAA